MKLPKVFQYQFLKSSQKLLRTLKEGVGRSPGSVKRRFFVHVDVQWKFSASPVMPGGCWCFIVNPPGDILRKVVCYMGYCHRVCSKTPGERSLKKTQFIAQSNMVLVAKLSYSADLGLWFCIVRKMKMKRTFKCVLHSTRIAGNPWQFSRVWEQKCIRNVENAIKLVYTFTYDDYLEIYGIN